MKTLSFEIESAILFHREKDAGEAQALGIQPIDMVVCNLYPFEAAAADGVGVDELIEQIDIGGPTMIRAAAKNYPFVAVVVDPGDYEGLVEELKLNSGALGLDTREALMRKAFNRTADYDAAISCAMDGTAGIVSRRLAFTDGSRLRYGENWHQSALFYRQSSGTHSLFDMELLGGKELSYNNVVDIQAAVESVADLRSYGCSIVKHATPCGLAAGDDPLAVFSAAWAGDPISAFGSVIAFNGPVDEACARFLELDSPDKSKRKFVEVVLAPDFTPGAVEYLGHHKALRIVRYDPASHDCPEVFKFTGGSLLEQERDMGLSDSLEWVTEAQGRLTDESFLRFGLASVKHVKSNAITVVRRTDAGVNQLLGMGAGQPNRVVAVHLAARKCRENLLREYEGSPEQFEMYVRERMGQTTLFSDAFFPFADNIDLCGKHGIKSVVQPGGSMRDKRVVKRCNQLGIAMAFTGVRHFRH